MKTCKQALGILVLVLFGSWASAQHPDGYTGSLIVVNKRGNDASFIDLASGEILRTMDTRQSGSHMLALPADGRVAYTSNGSSDSVSVIDVGAGQFDKSISVPDRPEAIGTNISGSEIWVGRNDEGVVTVFSAADGSELEEGDTNKIVN